MAELAQRKSSYSLSSTSRVQILNNVLMDGAAWETSSAELIATVDWVLDHVFTTRAPNMATPPDFDLRILSQPANQCRRGPPLLTPGI